MKKNIIILVLTLIAFTGFSQELGYDIFGTSSKPVEKSQLINAKSMSDINPEYPSSWITKDDYVSSEIKATWDGERITASGANDVLTSEQQDILKNADMGTNIDVEVKYKTKNSITQSVDIKTMNFSVSLVPELEAEYVGGQEQMKAYLKKAAVDKISESSHNNFELAKVRFIVDEDGRTSQAQIMKTSESNKVDELLLETIANMPKWKPAEDANGVKVKQEFEFLVGMMMGC